MEITQTMQNDVVLISLEGDLDYHFSAKLRGQFDGLIENKTPKVLINLSRVTYLDSSILANFVELSQKLKRSGGKLAFCQLSDKVKTIFDLAKMNLFFSVTDSEKEALDLLGR